MAERSTLSNKGYLKGGSSATEQFLGNQGAREVNIFICTSFLKLKNGHKVENGFKADLRLDTARVDKSTSAPCVGSFGIVYRVCVQS